MKNNSSLLCSCVFTLVSSLGAADFEGKVTMKITGPRDLPPALNYSIKGTATRIDLTMPGEVGRVAMLSDSAKSEMTILLLDQKMFMAQPLPKISGTTIESTGAALEASLEKSVVTEKILGYDCVKYTAKSPATTTELWVTDKLGTFAGFGGGNPLTGGLGGGRGGASAQPWEKALASLHAFPLRVVVAEGGQETFRMEATAVVQQSVSSSLFVAPTDFQDLSAMLKGMSLPPGMKLPGGN